jgi:Zn-dependent protease
MTNCVLFVFNMIPLPPLDGHYLLDLFLSERARLVVRQLGIFGILIAWYLSRPLFDLVLPPIQNLVLRAFGAA